MPGERAPFGAVRPIATLGAEEARSLVGLLFDLDDTLLTCGELTEAAYAALFRLRDAGLRLVATTGRPAGWGEVLAAQWPVDAVVTENGAVALRRVGRRVERLDAVDPEERRRRRRAVAQLVDEIRARWPELELADDASARVSDLTLDVGERRAVRPDTVAAAAALVRARGARALRSSIHLHVTHDDDDKASGTLRAVRNFLGVEPAVARSRFAFVGDSENDASCFAAFGTSIAVANLSGHPPTPPRYVTARPMGEGFAEAAAVLVARRGG